MLSLTSKVKRLDGNPIKGGALLIGRHCDPASLSRRAECKFRRENDELVQILSFFESRIDDV